MIIQVSTLSYTSSDGVRSTQCLRLRARAVTARCLAQGEVGGSLLQSMHWPVVKLSRMVLHTRLYVCWQRVGGRERASIKDPQNTRSCV